MKLSLTHKRQFRLAQTAGVIGALYFMATAFPVDLRHHHNWDTIGDAVAFLTFVVWLYGLSMEWWRDLLPLPVTTRESPYYMTVAELMERLEEIDDKTCVVVDRNNYPINGVTAGYDPDFATSIRLEVSHTARDRYMREKLKRKGSAV